MTSPPRSVHSTDGKPADDINERPASFIGDWTAATIDTHGERLVQGPDGNSILCDSPVPSEPPAYAGPDDSSSISPHTLTPQTSRETDKRPTTTTRRSASSSERAKPRRIIGNYTLINTLGSGSMGKVRLAVHNITGDKLAVKIVPRHMHAKDKQQQQHTSKKKDKDEHREIRTIREASIMLLLHHPFIASLKEMLILDPYYYLFMEYVNGGQLLDYIISHGKLKEKQARRFGRQILSALDYCHRNSIVHRDLKIENILISQAGNIKIIDFGLSNLFSPRSSLSTFCGSLYFAAPELLNAKAYTGPEVDVWSFGVVLYVLVCGKVPFDDQNMPALHEKIKRGVVDYPSHLSTDCKSVLSRMLVTNPAHRATVSEIMIHPWMNKGYDGPIDNYLPDRIPLSLPIDMEVVRGMTGFEFGTEIDIRDKLQDIITSEEYQKAAKTLMERTAQAHRNQRQGHLSSRFSPPHLGKKALTLPNDDPQSIPAAYHPLISIYYLVKERMEREKRMSAAAVAAASENSDLDSPRSTSTTSKTSLRMPDIALPETVHPTASVPFEQSLFGDPDMFSPTAVSTGVAYGKKGKTQIRVDQEGHLIDNDKLHLIENGLSRLFSRSSSNGHGGRHSVQSDSGDEEIYDLNRTFSHESSSNNHRVLRRLSHALSRKTSTDRSGGGGDMSAATTTASTRSRKSSVHGGHPVVVSSTSTPIQIPSRESNTGHVTKSYAAAPKFPNSLFSPPKQQRNATAGGGIDQSDLDVATAAAAAASVSSNNGASNTFSNKISRMIPRRMTLGQNAMNAENHTNFLNMVGNHQPSAAITTTTTSSGSTTTTNKRLSLSSQQQHSLNEGRLASAKGPVSELPSHVTAAAASENSDLGLSRHVYDHLYNENNNPLQQHNHEQAFPTSAHTTTTTTKVPQKGTADENIKPVFLKGLFSVTTTSTKHPSVIRADLIRVLERIGVKWRESKGRFECVHMPSIDLNRVVDTTNNNSSSLEDQAMQGHPSFSSEDHTTSNTTTTTTTPVVPLPDLVVRFEIYIVKVPWLLGMHGLQFRRVGGDPWQYKNMCSKILAELKL